MTSTEPKRWTEPGHVEERLVDGDPLHERREVAEYRHDLVGEPLVLGEVPGDERQIGTQALGAPARHATLHTEPLRLVRRGQHHAAADGDGPPAQLRVQQLLDRRVEGVEIGVQDRGTGWHRVEPSRTPVRSQVAVTTQPISAAVRGATLM